MCHPTPIPPYSPAQGMVLKPCSRKEETRVGPADSLGHASEQPLGSFLLFDMGQMTHMGMTPSMGALRMMRNS